MFLDLAYSCLRWHLGTLKVNISFVALGCRRNAEIADRRPPSPIVDLLSRRALRDRHIGVTKFSSFTYTGIQRVWWAGAWWRTLRLRETPALQSSAVLLNERLTFNRLVLNKSRKRPVNFGRSFLGIFVCVVVAPDD